MEYEVTKDFDQITLKDDFMFFSVMSDKELCKELLERILDIKIKKLVYVAGQDTKKDSYDIFSQFNMNKNELIQNTNNPQNMALLKSLKEEIDQLESEKNVN